MVIFVGVVRPTGNLGRLEIWGKAFVGEAGLNLAIAVVVGVVVKSRNIAAV